mgnify:CR=1 FL=1
MEVELWRIEAYKDAFKKCENCGYFNCYERKECHVCFSKRLREITQKDIEDEIGFWTKYGYAEEEIKNMLYKV